MAHLDLAPRRELHVSGARLRRHALGTLVAWLAASPALAVGEPPTDVAARTELHPIASLTITDQQFLTGDREGTPVTIAGQPRIAQGTGRLPVVILQHGSSGYAANVDAWARVLNAAGISTFALDGFTGRGLTEVNSNQAAFGRLNLIVDIYRALEVLAAHPRVDPRRIAVMGFSRGGQAVLYASVERFQELWNRSGVEIAAYIPFYPDCMTMYRSDTRLARHPIRIFGGALDDYNPVAACQKFVERLRGAGADVSLTIYPGASHAFDNPLGARPARIAPTFESVRRCSIHEDVHGHLVNATTGQPFTYRDTCVEHGPHLGYDPDATRAATAAVTAFLKAVFGLDGTAQSGDPK